MKARFTLLALPLMVGVALAQASGSGSQSGQTGQTSGQTPQTQMQSENTSSKTTASTSTSKSGEPAQMKTMTYKGTLVDLGCGGGAAASTATTAKSTAASTAEASAGAPTSSSANRSAGDSSCAVSANTSQFGLKTDAGQTYRFDMVGNQRAQDQFKANKHWNESASANKPLKVKISGVVQGDKLIVSSIH